MNCEILYLIGQLHAGGSERQLYYLLREMDRFRYQPALVVWNFSKDDIYVRPFQELGVPIYDLPNGSSSIAKLRAFCRIVTELQPQIVHSYSAFLNFAVHWSALGTNAIAFGSTRSDFVLDWEGSSWLLGCLNARWPRKQIYNSFKAAKSASRSKSPFVPNQLFVVHNGVDLERTRVLPLSTVGRPRVVGIGSLLPVKRWDRLVLAASELKGRDLDFSVHIAGDGPLRKSLQQQIDEHGLHGRFELLGHVKNVFDLLAGAAFLVHVSDAEGCPNAVMEAMACGRAVIATDVGDIPFLVEDGKTGFVVPGGDNAMLAERIVQLLRDRHLCCHMGAAARAKAERDFGLDRFVCETLDAYRAAGWRDTSLDRNDPHYILERIA